MDSYWARTSLDLSKLNPIRNHTQVQVISYFVIQTQSYYQVFMASALLGILALHNIHIYIYLVVST